MRVSEQFPSKYLKAEVDISKRPKRYIMEAVDKEDINGDMKMVLYFKGLDKGLVLNKTNASDIANLYGDDTDDWADQPILLYSKKVEYGGNKVDGIRVMPPVDEEERPARRAEPEQRRPISQQAAPRRRQDFDQTDEFPGDNPPLDAYEDA